MTDEEARALKADVAAFVEVTTAMVETQSAAMASMAQTLAMACQHINAIEGAVMKLIRITDPEGAERNGVAERVGNA